MEKDLAFSSLADEFPALKDKLALNKIMCKNGRHAIFVCFRNQCQKYPFLCSGKVCQCKKDHQNCFKTLLEDLINKIKSKTIDFSQLIQQNDKAIDLLVQNLVNKAAKIKKIFKQKALQKSKNLSFSKKQQQILTNIHKNQVKHLKGNDFYRIYTQLERYQKYKDQFKIQNNVQNFKKQIQEGQLIWKNIQRHLISKINQVQKQLQHNQYGFYQECKVLASSKIIKTVQQNSNIKKFFNKQIKHAQLLYRASQNQFKILNFKNKCCQIPNTLTLIETQFDKKIGGFTPLVWCINSSYEFTPDLKNQTFLFSLTQNKKFNQINLESGIANDPTKGPIFGTIQQQDLSLVKQANKKSFIGTFGNGFKDSDFKSKSHNRQTHYKLNGNPDSKPYVRAKEWQVWRIIF